MKLTNNVAEAIAYIQNISRRDFLRTSAAAAGLSAVGTASVAPNPAAASVPEGIVHMSASEYAVFYRLMNVLLPTDGSILVSPETLPVLQTVDGALLAALPPHILQGLKGGLVFFDQAPQDMLGATFKELTDADAAAFCDALAGSDDPQARGLFSILKFLIVTAYWAIPNTWEPIGFGGPVFEEWGVEYAGNAPLPQA